MTTPPKSVEMGYWRIILLGSVLALVLLPASFTAAALPLLRTDWNASSAAIGWVFAAYQAGYVLSVIVLLPLTDRIPIQRVIIGCSIVSSLAFLGFSFLARDVWSAAFFRFFAGIGLAGIYMPGTRVVAFAVPAEKRGLAVGAYVSAFYLGGALSLWSSGLLIARVDWPTAALILGIVASSAIPLAIYATRGASTPPGRRGSLDMGVLRDGPVMRTISAYTGHSWELYVSRSWLAAFLASALLIHGMDATSASAEGSQWAALMAGLGTPGVFMGGWLSDRMGRARAALLIAISSGVISLGFGFLHTSPWPLIIVVGCLLGLLMSADSAIYSTAITEWSPPERLGSAQAFQAFIGFGGSMLAPVVAGWMLDHGSSWGALFAVGGIFSIGMALPLIPLIRKRRGRTGRTV
ncbi:MFS transporter [Candidatus Oscillochloris fontis]|uniref:MFS transporter n=1 Tax=Candidatus Oscillochloris fontis TaxID=2496868 RepID=UPI00137579C2|nr:MFS transporter [Candidatus Oscillochloris fontis]